MLNNIIEFMNVIFQPIIDLGAAPMMMILIILFTLLMGVNVTKAFEGGFKLAVAITGMGKIIDLLTVAFNEPLKQFVINTGIHLPITDLGWAPIATITWASPYAIFFLVILVMINVVLLILNKTNTLDIDIFNFWLCSSLGLIIIYYSNSLLLAAIFVLLIGILKFINSDLMKPTFNEMLDIPEENPTTTTHLTFMLNPLIMVLDKFFDKFLYKLDKYDFDATKLNNKIGFWGSDLAIGGYLGIFIGLLGNQTIQEIFELSFIGAVALELFSYIGSWFISALDPLSVGITNFTAQKFPSRKFYIGIDWAFIGARPEIWAVSNILAPVLLIMALLLPGNEILPLAGIIAIGLTPALLIVCRGKMIRMIVIGTIMIPLFLWSGTLIAPMITELSQTVGIFPEGLAANQNFSHSTKAGPVVTIIAVLLGKGFGNFNINQILIVVLAIACYLSLFFWYAKQMKIRNIKYEMKKSN